VAADARVGWGGWRPTRRWGIGVGGDARARWGWGGLGARLGVGVGDGRPKGIPEPAAPAAAQREPPNRSRPRQPLYGGRRPLPRVRPRTLPQVLPRWLETRGAAGVRRAVPPTPERLIRAREDLARRTPASPSDINHLGQERSVSPRPVSRATPEPLPSSNRPTTPQSTPTPGRTPRPGPGGAWPARRAPRAACPRPRS